MTSMINTIVQFINYLRLVKLRDLIDRSFADINRQLYHGDNDKLFLTDTDIVRIDNNSHRLYVNTNIGNLYLIKQFKDKLFFTMYVGSMVDLLDDRLIHNSVVVSNVLSSYNESLDVGIMSLHSNMTCDMALYYTTAVRWNEIDSLMALSSFVKEVSSQVEMATTHVVSHINMLKDFNSLDEEFNLEESGDDDEYNNYADFR